MKSTTHRISTLVLLLVSLAGSGCGDSHTQSIITSDLDRFWIAYDSISATTDTARQLHYLEDLYLDPGSPGLQDLITVRNYTPEEILQGITAYPQFWKSLRGNASRTEDYRQDIEDAIGQLRKAYPDLQPADIYLAIGAFRTSGTVRDRNVLIGSEMALADSSVITSELPVTIQDFVATFQPLRHLPLLCAHEYVHTQQGAIGDELLSRCLYEGVAEFVSCHATGMASNTPAIAYGRKHEEVVIDQFVEDLFLTTNDNNWLWGENRNALQIRDLGYYIGYEIARRYHDRATDKQSAIKALIEVDYNDPAAVARIVDASALLPQPVAALRAAYQERQPTVVSITEFKNGDTLVSPNVSSITVTFSEALNGIHNGLDYGPRGEDFYPAVDNATRQWGPENNSYSFTVTLEPDRKYQMVIGSNFRLRNGIRLQPYLIEFHTAER